MTTTPHALPDLGPGAPTAPIALTGGAESATAHPGTDAVAVPDAVLERLRGACASVSVDAATRAESSRDWWPLAMTWALEGQVPGLAAAVARPSSPAEVAAILTIANEAGVPVTAAAGRSGVCGSSVPLYGGIVLDLCDLKGIRSVDDTSLTADVLAGTFGDYFEHELRTTYGLTCGHWPQSVALSTVGGWLACRGAGQLSTRYGKIEDMVVGLDVVLADGTEIHTEGNARQATGPDLNQVFVGSEGTLGIITAARLRLHPAPAHERRIAYGFPSFVDGLDACRRILRRGATPAVLRLYDAVEADRSYQTGDLAILLVLDEGDPALVDATIEIVEEECQGARHADVELVEQWMGHRNNVAQLEALISGGLVVDTMEITGSWAALPTIYEQAVAAIKAVPGTLAASAHQSHAYPDGACLYFTFAGKPGTEPAEKDAYYRAAWDAGTRAVLANGGALSHHHGVGINRARFMAEALGAGHGVLRSMKQALDPKGILNPGKLGLDSPFGPESVLASPDGLDRRVTDPLGDSPDQPRVVDVTAVLRGGAAALVIVVPAVIGQRIASEGSSLKGLLFLIVLIGFGWGGAVAAKAAPPGRSLTNGGLAGLAAVVAYLIIAVVVRLATDSPVDAVPLAFTAFLGVSCGILGAELGDRRRRRAPATDADSGDDGTEPQD